MKKRVKIQVELDDNQGEDAQCWLEQIIGAIKQYDLGRIRMKVQVGSEIARWTNEANKAESEGH